MIIFKIIEEIEKRLNYPINNFFKENENKSFGEYSINLAFKKAKEENRNLIEVANEIANKIKNLDFIEKVEVINGYINIFLNYEKIAKDIILQEISFSKENKKILVEHTSVNPNKALHIGHLRNSCIGDCLANLLKFFGNKVIVSNYIDDTGSQIAELILAFKELNYSLETNEKFDIYCSKIYPEVNKLIENREDLKVKLKEILKSLESYDEFSEKIIKKVLLAQLETLKKFKIKYNVLIRERDILNSKIFNEALEVLEKNNLIVKKDCIYIKFENKEIPITRSDNTTLYLGKDIAFALWKHGALKKDFLYEKFDKFYITSPFGKRKKFNNFDVSINVIDVRQKDEQKVVSYVIKTICNKEYIHFPYEVVALSKKTAKLLGIEINENILHMSGRKGIFINVDDIIEKLKSKIREINPKLKENLIEKIAINTVKYELLKYSTEKMIIFDIEDSLNLKGNTAIYSLYSYVRLTKILKKAKQVNKNFEVITLNQFEKELLFHILNFPLFLKSIRESLRINLLTNYLYELSYSLNRFYENSPVLKADEKTKNFRLNLLLAVKRIYDIIFKILNFQKIGQI